MTHTELHFKSLYKNTSGKGVNYCNDNRQWQSNIHVILECASTWRGSPVLRLINIEYETMDNGKDQIGYITMNEFIKHFSFAVEDYEFYKAGKRNSNGELIDAPSL